jgi:hypothetical protein
MVKKFNLILMGILVLVGVSLACGSVQVGVVTPTAGEQPTQEGVLEVVDEGTPVVEISTPTVAAGTDSTQADYAAMWIEYWDPKYSYGVALPSHWIVYPTPTEGYGGVMTAASYDEAYFLANSIKGWWIGGQPPEGAVKMDFVGLGDTLPQQSLGVAVSEALGADPETTVVLSVEDTTFGTHPAVWVTTAPAGNLDETFTSAAFRLPHGTILLVSAFPNQAFYSRDVQAILSSLVYGKGEPIIKPAFAPFPPLMVSDQVSGLPTATNVVAWYGHIASLPPGETYDDKVVLSPQGTGEFGIQGLTPELETEIQGLRDAGGAQEYVHLWGVLYCNVSDYNTCRLVVERLAYGDQVSREDGIVQGWVGVIQSRVDQGGSHYVFALSGGVVATYGISGTDEALQGQIEALSDSGTQVKVWGDLLLGGEDVNRVRIEAHQFDPSEPGALPSSAACEPGFFGTADEMLEVLQYNLEIGNYYPFSYSMGNPFVIGYWRSEGVTYPREQALEILKDGLFPAPGAGAFISDPALFPDLDGMPLDSLWGPEVQVAANLYSQGWGPDGQGEAILVVAQCSSGPYDGYYWYGMLYAMDGFK